MKCDKCGENAYTILDSGCDKCAKRLCKDCAAYLKCKVCRIPYCECYGLYCPNDNIHESLSWYFSVTDIRNDEYWQRVYSKERLEKDYQEDLKVCIDRWHSFNNDVEFVDKICHLFRSGLFECTSDDILNRVKKAGKLSLELAKYITEKLQEQISREHAGRRENTMGNEELHKEADQLWKWYIDSMKFYTSLNEAKEIAEVIAHIDRSQFWYA